MIMDPLETPDKDLPLRDDIRLLGRILGDTVRSQEGEPVFGIVEHIRRTSIRFHREEDEAASAKAPWPTRLIALVMRTFPVPGCRTFSRVPSFARYSPPIRRR